MIFLSVLLACALCFAMLLMLAILAGALVAVLYKVWPLLAVIDVDLSQPVRLPAWTRRTHQLEEPPVRIVLARSPLSNTEYLVGVASRKMVWTLSKQNARILLLSDRLAVRSWIAYAQRKDEGEVFICAMQSNQKGEQR